MVEEGGVGPPMADILGCSKWDCPFHSRSSLLLSGLVNSRPVLSSVCG